MSLPTPTLTVTAEDENARVRLFVQSGPFQSVTLQRVQVQRFEENDWVDVRGSGDVELDAAGDWEGTVFDVEAPSRGDVTYRARVVDASDPAVEDPSDFTGDETVAVNVTGFWLVDPEDSAAGGRIRLDRAALTWGRDRLSTAFAPLGKGRHVVVSGPRRGRRYQLTVLAIGKTVSDRVEQVTDPGRPLLLRTDDGDVLYVVPMGELEVSVEPTATRADRPVSRVSLELLEVDRPGDFTGVPLPDPGGPSGVRIFDKIQAGELTAGEAFVDTLTADTVNADTVNADEVNADDVNADDVNANVLNATEAFVNLSPVLTEQGFVVGRELSTSAINLVDLPSGFQDIPGMTASIPATGKPGVIIVTITADIQQTGPGGVAIELRADGSRVYATFIRSEWGTGTPSNMSRRLEMTQTWVVPYDGNGVTLDARAVETQAAASTNIVRENSQLIYMVLPIELQ